MTASTAFSMPRFRRDRVGAGRDVAQALADQRLGQDGRGGRAVTGDVVRLLGDLLDELRTDLLVRVVELDLLGDGDAVVRDRGGAPLLLEDDVAAARAERHLDGVGQDVQAALEAAAGLLVESNDLCHVFLVPPGRMRKIPSFSTRSDGVLKRFWHSRRWSARRAPRRRTTKRRPARGTALLDQYRCCSGQSHRLGLRALLPGADLERRPAGPLREPCIPPCRSRSSGRKRPVPRLDGDEAEALLSVEPLHGSVRHALLPLLCRSRDPTPHVESRS